MTVILVYNDVHKQNYSLTFGFSDYFAGMACMVRVCKQQLNQRYLKKETNNLYLKIAQSGAHQLLISPLELLQ